MTKREIDFKEGAAVLRKPYDFAIVVRLEEKNESGKAKIANVTTSVSKE